MAKKEHLNILKQGVAAWNKWRAQNPSEKPDLFNVNLRGANLTDVNLRDANLWEADLNKARLWRADLSGADISFANLNGADLKGASLRGANLIDADLNGADISFAYLRKANMWGANLSHSEIANSDFKEANLSDSIMVKTKISHSDFSNADLSNSDFSDSNLEWSTFGDTDLGMVKGLDRVHHSGPSTIGVDTLFRSKGNIPESFLHGAGVPKNLIDSLSRIFKNPTQFYSCLIQADENDMEEAVRLCNDLIARNVRCWYMAGQTGIKEKAGRTVGLFEKTVILFSESSLNGQWMENALKAALEEESKKKYTILYLIRTDGAILDNPPEWAEEALKNRKIIDFSNSDDADQYRKSVDSLLEEMGHIFQDENSSLPKKDGIAYFPNLLYKIIWENNCPHYNLEDRIKLTGQSIFFPDGKPTCFILVSDIIQVNEKYKNLDTDAGYAFKCSGCTGSIRIAYTKEDDDELKQLDPQTANMISLLADFPMFHPLDRDDIKYLAAFLKIREYEPGEIVMNKGDPGKNLYILSSGKVEVVGDAGLSIAFMGKGEVFGEMSLLSGKPAGATIKVVEPSTILYLSSKDFRNILNRIPSLQMYFTNLLAQRLNEIHDVRSKEFASGMVGKLSEMPPSELFQTLNANQKTGVISLELSKGNASLSFREGGLIKASYSNKEGKDAFYETLKEKQGRFKFIPGLPKEEKNLDELGDFMWLLMEGMRKIDEEEEEES